MRRELIAYWYSEFFTRGGWTILERACGRRSARLLRDMQLLDCLPREVRQARLDAMMRTTLMTARGALWYGEHLDHSALDVSIPVSEILATLPILTKEQLRLDPRQIVTRSTAKRLPEKRTSGSTGEPLTTYADPNLGSVSVAAMAFCRSWWDIVPGAPAVNLWGHGRYLSGTVLQRIALAKRQIADRMMNRRVCTAYDLSEAGLARFGNVLHRFRPDYVVGYASALAEAARYFEEHRTGVPELMAVVSTAEMLYPWQREIIERSFGAPVIQEYGLSEAGIIAYSCPRGKMHVIDAAVQVDIVDESGERVKAGEIGRVIVSLRQCDDVPMLRYDTGDLAMQMDERCSCGRPQPVIGPLQGRAYDIIWAANGRAVPGVVFTHVMKSIEGIAKYQVVQWQRGSVDIRFVESGAVSDDVLSRATSRLHAVINAPLHVSFHRTDEIPAEPSGKYRWIKSALRSGIA